MSRRVFVFFLCVALPAGLLLQMTGAHSQDAELGARMTGAAEVPGPGDDAGSGRATFYIEGGQLCGEVRWSGIDAPHAGHIHAGRRGKAGPVVVSLLTRQLDAGVHRLEGCINDADPAIVDDIFQNPSNYYVNLHNEKYPNGAIRGQLASQ